MESKERLQLLKGKGFEFEHLEKSNIVRIFVSSTFSDMADERNLLLEKAYPILRKFCQELGLDFQAVDMRWGIQDNANVDHSTCKLCLQEITTCRRLSVGPYFVAFVGNRYGYRPIPSTIGLTIYEKFCQITDSLQIKNAALLEEWYKLDDNAVPPCYILQPITCKYSWFDDVTPEHSNRRKTDRKNWERESQELSQLLRRCAYHGIKEKEISEEEAMLFFKSVTQQEIEKGTDTKNSPNSIYFYFREIMDVKRHVEEPAAGKFVDMRDDGVVDNEAQDLLEKLKTKINSVKGEFENVKKYDVKWISDKGISTKFKSHVKYLETFCKDFIDDLKLSIRSSAEMKMTKDESNNDLVVDEVAHHTKFAVKKWQTFCGRTLLVDKILQLVFAKNVTSPCVVFGASGKGKTALMAKIVHCCQERESTDVVVCRFLGTSPNSSNIHNVLQTIILQVHKALSLPPPASYLLENFNNVMQMFTTCLMKASEVMQSEGKELIIVLDSLDQLSPLDGAYRLKWLPKQMPKNVKILLSTLPDPNLGILERLHKLYPSDRFLEVTDLDEENGKEILQMWLANENRCLTESQNRLIIDLFTACPNPLFLKLAFDEAKTWHSYTDVATLKMASTTRGAISLFFDRLEKVHGQLFVSRAIGYLVAAKNGITENELEDLLSLDDEILDDSYRYWSPPSDRVVRIPSLLWARLRHDFGTDLVERQADGYRVLSLYHRQFIETARERCLGESVRSLIHQSLAHYFLGTWSDGKQKPLRLKIMKNKLIKADRQVASQPYKFSDRVFNYRKLSELPFHLINAQMWTELHDSVLCNAQWIQHKIQAFSIKSLLEDYDMALEVNKDNGILMIRDAIKLAKPTLEFPGGIRNHVCTELYGRLAFFAKDFPKTVGVLVDRSSAILEEDVDSKLVPLTGCFQPPGSSLRTTLTGFKNPISSMIRSEDKSVLIAGSYDGWVMVWLMGDDETLFNTKAHEGAVTCLAVAGPIVASGSVDGTLQIINFETESKVGTITEDHTGYERHASLLLNKQGTVLVSAFSETINVWNLESLQCKYTFTTTPPSTITCSSILLVEDEHVFASYSDDTSHSWSILTGVKQHELSHTSKESRSHTNDHLSCKSTFHFVRGNYYLLYRDDGYLFVKHLIKGEIQSQLVEEKSHLVALNESGDTLAISVGNIVRLWSVVGFQVQELGSLRFHRKPISVLNFHNLGNHLFVGSSDQYITVWEVGKEKFVKNQKPTAVIQGMGASVDHLVSFDDVIASASSKVFYCKLWNWNRKRITEEPETILFDVKNNAISPCGYYFAVCNNTEKTVTFHNIAQYNSSIGEMSKTKVHFATHELNEFATCVCFCSNKSDQLLIGSKSGKVLKVFNPLVNGQSRPFQEQSLGLSGLKSRREIQLLSKGEKSRYALAVACEEAQCLTEGFETSFCVLDSSAMTLLHEFTSKLFGINSKVTAVCFGDAHREHFLAIIGTNDCKVYVVAIQQDSVGGLCTSKLLDVLEDHTSPITALALSFDQKMLFSGSAGQTKRLWRLEGEKWKLHRDIFFKSLLKTGTTRAVFTKDGKYVISGSRERSLKVWEVETGEMIAAQYVYATVTGLGVTDTGLIVATTKMGYVIVNNFKPSQKQRTNEITRTADASAKRTARVVRLRSNEKNSLACLLL